MLFPYKVLKALDPEIYRNVEFDVWLDSRKGNEILTTCFWILTSRGKFFQIISKMFVSSVNKEQPPTF